MCIRINRIVYILSISILFLNSCATQQTGNIENGYGKITFSTGASYEGNFKDGKYHGIGTWYNSTNSLYGQGGYYTGEWYEGLMHGKGLKKTSIKNGHFFLILKKNLIINLI